MAARRQLPTSCNMFGAKHEPLSSSRRQAGDDDVLVQRTDPSETYFSHTAWASRPWWFPSSSFSSQFSSRLFALLLYTAVPLVARLSLFQAKHPLFRCRSLDDRLRRSHSCTWGRRQSSVSFLLPSTWQRLFLGPKNWTRSEEKVSRYTVKLLETFVPGLGPTIFARNSSRRPRRTVIPSDFWFN